MKNITASHQFRQALKMLFRSEAFNDYDKAIMNWIYDGGVVRVSDQFVDGALHDACANRGPHVPNMGPLICELSAGHLGDHREGSAKWVNKPLTAEQASEIKRSLLEIHETLKESKKHT